MRTKLNIFCIVLSSALITAVSAKTLLAPPRIITRAEWGADEELLTNAKSSDIEMTLDDVGELGDDSIRAKECEDLQRQYPEEFATAATNLLAANGKPLRWPQKYSKEIKLIVIHHTAIKVSGDDRSPDERMRALYQYHADKNGWGDIGYNYVIDESGRIYEGRSGGKYAVGGHVYCANVGTIGVALMGNFEEEQPSQAQLKSLKYLTAYLAQEYDINPRAHVRFHGQLLPTIVGHRDLGRTLCPGYYVYQVLDQIRSQVIAGKFGSAIKMPSFKFRKDGTQKRKTARLSIQKTNEPILESEGKLFLTVRPGGQILIRLSYRAGSAQVPRRARIAEVERSDDRIGIWQTMDGQEVRVRREIMSPETVKPLGTEYFSLRILVPRKTATYKVKIGELEFTIQAQGRRVRPDASPQQIPLKGPELKGSVSAPLRISQTAQNAVQGNGNGKTIRIKLGFDGTEADIITSTLPIINGDQIGSKNINLSQANGKCEAQIILNGTANKVFSTSEEKRAGLWEGGISINSETIRIDTAGGISTINNWNRKMNRFRGAIECRIIGGELALINELPLEDYLKGLAEEPDSEPYEKQRAFAIAARSYSAYYMHPLNRKFPDMPFDGDDSPARFQLYQGVYFEENNPNWVKAVESTANKVIMKNGEVVKTPYFSSDDGRTRSPEEAGWKHFPNAEVFQSKSDPWCKGLPMNGHGVGMSGCGAKGQANEGRKGEEILKYYYEGVEIDVMK